MEHPIMTFLLADSLITGLLKCISCFAPNREQEDPEDVLVEKIENKEEQA